VTVLVVAPVAGASASSVAAPQAWVDVLTARAHHVYVVAPPEAALRAEHHVAARADTADTVRAVADAMEGAMVGGAAPVLLLEASVANPATSVLMVEELAATSGTVALVTEAGPADSRLQVVSDVVVAAGSTRHDIGQWTHVGAGLVCVGPSDVPVVARALRVMADVAAENGWHDPPWPLIVVAAVRAGVVVRIVSAEQQRLPWADASGVPFGAGAADPVEALSQDAERRLRVAAASGPAQGFADRAFGAAAARALSLRVWGWGLGADAVTAVSVASALLAGLLVGSGSRQGAAVGAGFLLLSVLLDRVDGIVARATRSTSSFGAWLDATGDRLREAALVIGLGVGAAQADDPRWVLAAAALALLALAQLSAASSRTARGWGGAPAPIRLPLDRLDEPELPVVPPAPGRALPPWLPFSVSRGDGPILVVVGLLLLPLDVLLAVLAVVAAVSAVVCIVLAGSSRPLPAAQRQLWELADPGPMARVVARQDPQLSMLRRVLSAPVAAWVPPVTWVLEAGGVLAVVALADTSALPITLAWVGVLAFHRLDLATRLHVLGSGPPPWLGIVGLGAMGRLLLVVLLAGADLLTPGLGVVAVLLGVMYAAESSGRFADRP
jgi:hypothetical protein